MMRSIRLATIVCAAALAACDSTPTTSPDLATPPDFAGVPTFAVGGTVTGLSGSGLVLSLNGAATVSISADGAFSFAQKLPSGASYIVAVKIQPSAPAQSCVVTGGNGTIGTADVSNVQVKCTTAQVALGGVVVGYHGSGLVLQNNGGDDLSIGANGAFQFAKKIDAGAMYAVTVKTQPSGPKQSCSVSGDTGTAGTLDISSVVVNCDDSTFTVGGSYEGLNGSLELYLNGSIVTKITGTSGTFAFGTALPDLSPYSVTVKTAPGPNPAQTCVITHGNGTIAGANVSDVAISCSDNSYPVRIDLVGLGSGVSVTVQNHATDDTTLFNDGTWYFSSQASGTALDVTVSQQPGPNPQQTCVFTSGDPQATVLDQPYALTLTCAGDPFTVKASVTGLPVGQLVSVALGGKTPVQFDSNTTADLGQVPSGLTYTVSVTAQPDAPYFCFVSPSQGTMGASDVTVNVGCITAHKDCAEIHSLDATLPSGLYPIDPNRAVVEPFFVYCDMTTAGGGWTIVYSATGADNEQPLTSNTPVNGNPLNNEAYNLNRAQKMVLSALETESLFARAGSNQPWLRVDAPMFDANLDTPNSQSTTAVTLTANDGSTAQAYMGYANFNISRGGDFGISMRPDGGTCAGSTVNGFDHHSASYEDLNCGCARQYLYSYSASVADTDAGYDVNTGFGTWTGTDGCNGNEGGSLAFRAGMRRAVAPVATGPASCADILTGDSTSLDGVYTLFSNTIGFYSAYCDMTNGGWTLLLAARGNSTYWGNTSPSWSTVFADGDTPNDLTAALTYDYRSGAYGSVVTDSIRLCSADLAHCYTFDHAMSRTLASFYVDNVNFSLYSNNALFTPDTGTDTSRTDYVSALGYTMTTASCYSLGINYPNMGGGLGLIGDNNAGCASSYGGGSNFWMDDYALGLGVNSCNDGNCSPTNRGQSGAEEGASGGNSFGAWFVFGK